MGKKINKTTFHFITLFPESFSSYFGASIIKRAIEDKKIIVKFYNPRDFTKDKNHRVDQKPYGGGPGMVIEALPVIKAIEKAIGKKNKRSDLKKTKIFFLSPSGKQFDNLEAQKVANKFTDIIIICGRYEGIDARVNKIFKTEKISVGPYVLTGGELPAMIIADSVSRFVKGVLGNELSPEEMRVSAPEVYTRPEIIEYKSKKYKVPQVLLSGNHKKIDEWKVENKAQNKVVDK